MCSSMDWNGEWRKSDAGVPKENRMFECKVKIFCTKIEGGKELVLVDAS